MLGAAFLVELVGLKVWQAQSSLWNLWASRRGRCSIPCGTCGAEGVVGAVFLVELVASRRGRCNIPCGTWGPQGVVGAVFLVELVGFQVLVELVGLKAW